MLHEYKISSGALAALVLANALPLAGVWLLDLGLFALVMLYWMENGIVGVFSVVAIGLAPEKGALGKSKGYQIIFFVTHYATFWVMHAAAISYLVFANSGSFGWAWWAIPICLLSFILSHGVSFALNTWLDKGYARVSPITQMLLPYARVIPAHAFLLFAALVLATTDSSPEVLTAIVLGKLAIDITTHIAMHRWIASREVA